MVYCQLVVLGITLMPVIGHLPDKLPGIFAEADILIGLLQILQHFLHVPGGCVHTVQPIHILTDQS